MENEKNSAQKLSDLMNALGSTAELSFLFYSNLLRTGFDKNEALYLCKAFIHELVSGGKANATTDND